MPTYIGLLKLADQGSEDIMNAPARIDEGIKLYQKMGGKLIGVYLVMGNMTTSLSARPQAMRCRRLKGT